MDTQKVGKFLKELRMQNHMTQEQLGAKINVTNKTISRWETGTYMPPVEMLQELSELYNISINEILSGARLSEVEYKEKAEENIKSALGASTFTLKERIAFFKKKWRKDHRSKIILCSISWVVLIAALTLQGIDSYMIGTVGSLLAILFYVVLHNQMMKFVEECAFDGKGNE